VILWGRLRAAVLPDSTRQLDSRRLFRAILDATHPSMRCMRADINSAPLGDCVSVNHGILALARDSVPSHQPTTSPRAPNSTRLDPSPRTVTTHLKSQACRDGAGHQRRSSTELTVSPLHRWHHGPYHHRTSSPHERRPRSVQIQIQTQTAAMPESPSPSQIHGSY
jgi:hypothetical protein